MDGKSPAANLAGQLRDNGGDIWLQIENDVMPRVLAALRRRYDVGRCWHDLEGAARSAERVAWRLLGTCAHAQLEAMDSLEQLECWLIRVAGRKFNEALRRSAREAAHAPNVYLANHESYRLAELGQQASREVVEELECSLHDDTDRAVFRGKLNELTEAQIARQLRCSTRKIRGVWQRVRQRLSRCL